MPATTGSPLRDAADVVATLRVSCPWDHAQTHRSLARFLIEETYETVEAIERGDPAALREELGDVLLQVLLHAAIAAEAGEWTLDDVARALVAKLVRRHPHVFGEESAPSAADVEANWPRWKAAEQPGRPALAGVPFSLPSLALADKVLARAATAGVPVAPAAGSAASLPLAPRPTDEATRTDPSGAPAGHPTVTAPAIWAELLAVVARARAAGVDADQALRDAVRALADRIWAAEPDR